MPENLTKIYLSQLDAYINKLDLSSPEVNASVITKRTNEFLNELRADGQTIDPRLQTLIMSGLTSIMKDKEAGVEKLKDTLELQRSFVAAIVIDDPTLARQAAISSGAESVVEPKPAGQTKTADEIAREMKAGISKEVDKRLGRMIEDLRDDGRSAEVEEGLKGIGGSLNVYSNVLVSGAERTSIVKETQESLKGGKPDALRFIKIKDANGRPLSKEEVTEFLAHSNDPKYSKHSVYRLELVTAPEEKAKILKDAAAATPANPKALQEADEAKSASQSTSAAQPDLQGLDGRVEQIATLIRGFTNDFSAPGQKTVSSGSSEITDGEKQKIRDEFNRIIKEAGGNLQLNSLTFNDAPGAYDAIDIKLDNGTTFKVPVTYAIKAPAGNQTPSR